MTRCSRMEVITGVAPAEYGDKSSLVVHIVTKSGLDQAKPTGSASFGYGSFKSPTGDFNIGGGSHTIGDFAVVLRLAHRSVSGSAGVRRRSTTPGITCRSSIVSTSTRR